MAGYLVSDTRKVTTHRFMEMKQKGEKISMLTSYDYTMAGIVDKAGIDAILVGDSASNVMAGNATTLPMSVDYMIYHARSVARACQRALVVCDMPFGSYQVNATEGVSNAIRIMKESGCDALKMEGGEEILDTVKRILDAGIPVMAHLGLTPQSINKFGSYAVRAKEQAEADKLLRDAQLLDEVGCFGITLEKVPAYNSRYDRGHMCPAGDNKWDKQAMSESFLFTNICPQNPGLNKYEWNDVEMMCRDWARKYGAIDIVCGPMFDNVGEQKTIGKNKVWVPTRFFKVVLCRKGEAKAIGFIYRNEGKKQLMEDAVCSVDEVERLTGIDFFPALDDKTERKIEAKADLKQW